MMVYCSGWTVDGSWSEWSSWGSCSCETGTIQRERHCSNPQPFCHGKCVKYCYCLSAFMFINNNHKTHENSRPWHTVVPRLEGNKTSWSLDQIEYPKIANWCKWFTDNLCYLSANHTQLWDLKTLWRYDLQIKSSRPRNTQAPSLEDSTT